MSPTLFDFMSAAERKALANKILDMDYDSQRQLVEQLSGIVEMNAAAEAEAGRKQTALARINACKADVAGGRNVIALLNGQLRRGGLPSVEQLVEKTPQEIMALFANSKMSNLDKFSAKSTLSTLKLIP